MTPNPAPNALEHPVPDPPASSNPEIVVRRAGDGFEWPPESDQPEPTTQTPLNPPRPSRIRGVVESIETTLFGRTSLSFARRALAENWSPDPDSRYCWRCAGSIGAYETDGEGCAACRNTKLQWDQGVRLGEFEGILRDAVIDLKFHRWRTSGLELGRELGHAIRGRMERGQIRSSEIALVPIPISNRRRIKRGIDHTRTLARGASGTIGCKMIRVLAAKHRPEQIGLSMTARGRNIKGAFHVKESKNLNPDDRLRVIVLIDDVRTTGATMTAASKAVRGLLRAKKGVWTDTDGIEIWAATACVAIENARDRQILKK